MTTDDTRPDAWVEEVESAYSAGRDDGIVLGRNAERARHAATVKSLEQLTARHAALVAAPHDHDALHRAVDAWRLADADAHHSLADEADYERRDAATAALRAALDGEPR
jgi:hypothetical protein